MTPSQAQLVLVLAETRNERNPMTLDLSAPGPAIVMGAKHMHWPELSVPYGDGLPWMTHRRWDGAEASWREYHDRIILARELDAYRWPKKRRHD